MTASTRTPNARCTRSSERCYQILRRMLTCARVVPGTRLREVITIREHRVILADVRNADVAEAVARLESHLMQTKKGFKAALR
jgi:DNA-binding GntR family transcriptional regulator